MFKPHCMLIDSVMKPGVTEVIAVHSQNNYNCLKQFMRTAPWITLININETDAVKLLLERDGIGIGCYVRLHDTKNMNRHRLHMSSLKMDVISRVAKGFHAYKAIQLEIPSVVYKVINPIEREVLHIRH